jgi:hypothetical protein
VADRLCPGPSEMRGYLLWEYFGVKMRLAQWHWIRMKITTPVYLEMLIKLKSDLEEVVSILSPIRKDSDEGQMGLKARTELKATEKLISEMSRHSYKTTTLHHLPTPPSKYKYLTSKTSSATLNNRASMSGLSALAAVVDDRISNRRSICI